MNLKWSENFSNSFNSFWERTNELPLEKKQKEKMTREPDNQRSTKDAPRKEEKRTAQKHLAARRGYRTGEGMLHLKGNNKDGPKQNAVERFCGWPSEKNGPNYVRSGSASAARCKLCLHM